MDRLKPLLPYRPDYEHPHDDEAEAIDKLREVFVGMAKTVADDTGHALRAVHAKAHAVLRARLHVAALPPELSHGLFAAPISYDALVRLSSPPAEQLPDTVSTPRGLALKVFDVPGTRVDGGEGPGEQDFLMVNAPDFPVRGPAQFLPGTRLLASTTDRMPRTKEVISATLRGIEHALEAVGVPPTGLRALGGEPQHHPLGETYFAEVPFLYGPWMARFSLLPLSPELQALRDAPIENAEDGQREAVSAFFRDLRAPVRWQLRAQFCRDIETMPIEDASAAWSEAESPWVPVATLEIGRQPGWDEAGGQQQDDALAFSPWHALAAHRPLGAVNRARRAVYAASQDFRGGFNGCPLHR